MNTLAFGYVIPAIRGYRDLHPLDNAHAERTNKAPSHFCEGALLPCYANV